MNKFFAPFAAECFNKNYYIPLPKGNKQKTYKHTDKTLNIILIAKVTLEK